MRISDWSSDVCSSDLTPDDYPSRALREEREGTTGFKLAIDANGKVVDCQITSSSGSPDLDAEACKNLMRRARFRPAEDTDGNAMEIGRAHVELQSLMRMSYAVFCLKQKIVHKYSHHTTHPTF